MTNAFGAFEGGLISLPLGAARRAREKLDAHTMRAFDVQVPPGSPLLFASVTAAAPAEGEIDLYLFDCTGKRCTSAGTAIGHDTAPRLFRANPKAGLWKVVVVASRVAEGGVAFDYADVVADPALGGVTVTDGSRSRDVGAQWSAAANVWLAKPAEDGRQPEALLVVQATPKGGTPIPIGLQRVAIEVKAASDGSR
jgi:hypothetical protein